MTRFARFALAAVPAVVALAAGGVAAAPVGLRVQGQSLEEAITMVAEGYPEMMYVVCRGDEVRATTELHADSRDALMDAVLEAYGARGAVIDDIWVVEGTAPPARLLDGRAAVCEALPEGSAEREFVEASARDDAPQALREACRELIARLAERPEIPEGCAASGFVRLTPDDPLYGRILGPLLLSAVPRVREQAFFAPSDWRVSVDGDRVRSNRYLEADATVGLLRPSEDLPREVCSLQIAGPVEFDGAHPLSARVSLTQAGEFGAVVRKLGRSLGFTVSCPDPWCEWRMAVRLSDVPLGSAMVLLAAASGLPVPDLRPADTYAFGAGPLVASHWAQRTPNERLGMWFDSSVGVTRIVSRLPEKELADLRAHPQPESRYGPALVYAIERRPTGVGQTDPLAQLDGYLVNPRPPMGVYSQFSWTGEVSVGIGYGGNTVGWVTVLDASGSEATGRSPSSPGLCLLPGARLVYPWDDMRPRRTRGFPSSVAHYRIRSAPDRPVPPELADEQGR